MAAGLLSEYLLLIESARHLRHTGNILIREVNPMYLPREEGQGLVEYALILVLVAVVVIAILTLLGPQIGNVFSKITNGLSTT